MTIQGKHYDFEVFDDLEWNIKTEVSEVIQRFRENDVPTECYLIKQGAPIPITIPPKTNLVQFLRLMYMEHKSGKLYIPRQINKWNNGKLSNWELLMWGGGRQKVGKIKVVDVAKDKLPQTIALIELIGG